MGSYEDKRNDRNDEAGVGWDGDAKEKIMVTATLCREDRFRDGTYDDECAMSDIMHDFNKGYMRITGYDKHGRVILFANRILLTTLPDRSAVARIIFFGYIRLYTTMWL